MKLKHRTTLSIAVAMALYGQAGPVFAQDEILEEVVVTGIRGALQRSLDVKREADSHVEVISAEDIGKMPDRNIADSLQRVPGVTISAASANEGAFDENDRVSMRGTSPSYTQTLINGHNIASGDWFVLNQTGTVGRSVSYSLLPSELVEQVVVHKTYEAKQVEGGLTGSIDIRTRSPLNFDEGFTFGGNVGSVYSDLPGETDPQISALVNWKSADSRVGLMVQAFSQTRHLRRDGQEILGYNVIGAADAAAVAYPELTGVLYPSLMGSALFEQERERVGGQATLEFAATDNVNITLDGIMSQLDASN
jgi:iron complex outermembrane receptor protein